VTISNQKLHDKYAHLTIIFVKKTPIICEFNDEKHHSEINALRKLRYMNFPRGTKINIINIRFGKESVKCSKPCLHCAKALKKCYNIWSQIGYTINEGLMFVSNDEFLSEEYTYITSKHRR